MAVSKAEAGLYALGGISLLSAFALRKKIDPDSFRNAMIFGAGTAITAGAMTGARMHKVRKLRQLEGSLGLAMTEKLSRGGKTTKVYDDPEMGIKERVFLLQGLVADSVKDPEVRKLALAITGHGERNVTVAGEHFVVDGQACEARDDECEAKAIFDFIADPKNVRYTGDIGVHALSPGGPEEAVDLFQSAKRTLEFHGGDCDDHSSLAATLAIQNGFPAKFRITSNTGDSWDHIYTLVGVPKLNPKKWIALDTTLGPGTYGKEPGRAKYVDFTA